MSESTKLNRRSLMLGASLTAAAYVAACAKPSEAVADDRVDLSGLSILITGCSSGFGRLGAEHYARLGAKVFASMRNLPRPEATELEALAKSDNSGYDDVEEQQNYKLVRRGSSDFLIRSIP